MNRIVNNPDFVVEDMLKGFVKTHKDIVSTTEDARVLKYKNAPSKKMLVSFQYRTAVWMNWQKSMNRINSPRQPSNLLTSLVW